MRDVGFFLQSLALENKNVSFTQLDPARRGEEKLWVLEIQPYQIQSVKNNRVEFIDTYSAIVLEYLEGSEVIPLALSANSLEFDLALRIDFLLNKTSRKVSVLSGGDLNLERDCRASLQWLNLEGFETVPISDARILAEEEIDSPLLLYGTKSLSQEDSAAIENFILRGGAALIMTSPYSANVDGDWGITENSGDTFIPVLEKWGAAFDFALAADISNVRASFYSAADAQNPQSEYKYVNYPLWINLLPQEGAPLGLEFFGQALFGLKAILSSRFFSRAMPHGFSFPTVAELSARRFSRQILLRFRKPLPKTATFRKNESPLSARKSMERFQGFTIRLKMHLRV